MIQTHELNRESRLNRRKNEESSKSLEVFQKESIREREEWLMEIERLLDEVDTNKTELSRNSLKKQGFNCVNVFYRFKFI